MVDFLRDLLFRHGGRPAARGARHNASELQLAAAALMVEAAKLDGAFDDIERERIAEILNTRLGVDGDATGTLIEAAETEAEQRGGLYGFTREIRSKFSDQERIEMIEMLWEIVYVDGSLHDFEANLLRRVAGLLYVTDRESGEARKRVLDRLNGGDRPPGASG